MRRLPVFVFALWTVACVAEPPITADPGEPPPTEPTPPPAEPPPAEPPPAEPPPTLPDVDLEADHTCAAPRQAQVRLDATDDGRCMVVEHLDEAGCVAVRTRTTLSARITRVVVEVPGDARWAPQAPTYIDLTPRPQITTVEHDAAGREIATTVDEGADGTIELRRTQRWAGDLLVERVLERPEGTTRETWRHDAQGNEVRYRTEGETVSMIEQTWDTAGRRTERRTVRDGVIAQLETWTFEGPRLVLQRRAGAERVEETIFEYDAYGREAERVWTRIDHGQPLIVERHVSTWDAAGGRSVEYTRDDRVDGVIDERRRTLYDADGRETRVETDTRPVDGRADWVRAQRWDAAGRMIWWRNTQDGVVKLQRTWTYEGDALVETTNFPSQNRPITRRETWTRTPGEIVHAVYDDDVLIMTTRQRLDDAARVVEQITERDGRIVSRLRNTWGEADALIRSEHDADGDGVFEHVRVEALDAHGETAWLSVDTDGDGALEHWRRTMRDTAGRVVLDARAPGPHPLGLVHAPPTPGTPFRMIVDHACR